MMVFIERLEQLRVEKGITRKKLLADCRKGNQSRREIYLQDRQTSNCILVESISSWRYREQGLPETTYRSTHKLSNSVGRS